MPKKLKPPTQVFSVRILKPIKQKVECLSPEETEELHEEVRKIVTKKTKHII